MAGRWRRLGNPISALCLSWKTYKASNGRTRNHAGHIPKTRCRGAGALRSVPPISGDGARRPPGHRHSHRARDELAEPLGRLIERTERLAPERGRSGCPARQKAKFDVSIAPTDGPIFMWL